VVIIFKQDRNDFFMLAKKSCCS